MAVETGPRPDRDIPNGTTWVPATHDPAVAQQAKAILARGRARRLSDRAAAFAAEHTLPAEVVEQLEDSETSPGPVPHRLPAGPGDHTSGEAA